MTGIGAVPAGPIPRDFATIAARPRYAPSASPTETQEFSGLKKLGKTAAPSPNAPIPTNTRLRRIAVRFGELAQAAGDADAFSDASWLAGALAAAGDDTDGKPTARAIGLLRRPTQHRFETRLAKLERDEEIRAAAAQYPELSGRALAARLGVSEGTVRRALKV